MFLLKALEPPLSAITFCVILIAGASIASAKNGDKSRLNFEGWNPDSQVAKRDAPTTLVNSFYQSSWIWTAETNPPNAPAFDRAFRNTFTSPMGKVAASALILLSVDDRFSFYVNGNSIGTSPTTPDSWKNAHFYNVSLAVTTNVFAIRGTNLPDVNSGGPSPAGVLIAIQIIFSDESTFLLSSSSGGWRATDIIPSGFESPSFDDSKWTSASVLFKYGEGPWLSQVVLPTDVAPLTTLPVSTSSNPPTQSTAAPTATEGTTPGTHQPAGAIAGGVIGGIILLLLLVLAFWWRKRRPRRIRVSLFSQSSGFELGDRAHSHIEMTQPQINMPRTPNVPSPSTSSVHLSTITPSMSVSHVDQGDGAEFRGRIERLEGLVLELDREIALGGGGSQVAESAGEGSTHRNRDPFAGEETYNRRVRNIPPPAYEMSLD